MKRASSRERVAVFAGLLGAAVIHLSTFGQPLIEAHAFRQTQTAYTALIYAQDGIDLLHPGVPVLGPPYGVAFEFPLFQAIASLPMSLGAPADPTLRVTGFVFFLISALLLWLLLRRLAGAPAALAAFVAYLFSPYAVLWSRTAMIEYLVVAASLGYLFAGVAWRDRGGPALWLLAVAAGTIAMVVKVQSGAFWVAPLFAYRSAGRTWRDPRSLALAAVPLGVALAWTRYADGLRVAAPGTSWMSSVDLAPFLFGTPEEHLSLAAWGPIVFYVWAWICGPALIGLLIGSVPAIRAGDQRWFWTAVVTCPLLSIAIFLHVWSIHDYYSIAATPSVAVALGLAAAWLWRTRAVRLLPFVLASGAALTCLYMARSAPTLALLAAGLTVVVLVLVWRLRDALARNARRALVIAGAAALAIDVVGTVDYWGVAYAGTSGDTSVLGLSRELARLTTADEDVLMTGGDWSPVVLYYARRRGQMLPAALLTDEFVRTLPSEGYRTFFSWKPDVDALWPATEWPWLGALAPHTYALGQERSELRAAKAASTDDLAAFDVAARAGHRMDHPASIRCGEANDVPAGLAGSWLRIAPAGRDARIVVLSAGLGAMPARSLLVISPDLASGGHVRLGCAGADTIAIVDAVDAP